MKIRDLINRDPFKKLKNELDKFADTMLKDYLDELCNSGLPRGKKEIFDQVWGPVEFNAGEVAILDSPLIQRLRKIKQLGLASYVYCGADYSRFAHTIGVFKLSGDMAKIISGWIGDSRAVGFFRGHEDYR